MSGFRADVITRDERDVVVVGHTSRPDPPTQAEVQALRDKAEELADDLRNLLTLIHALRTALVAGG